MHTNNARSPIRNIKAATFSRYNESETLTDRKKRTLLEEININNLGIIKRATLPFTPGLTVLTGETGAGKTMVLSAINLLLGKRANSNSVSKNAQQLSVEGCWKLEEHAPTEQIEETGAELEEGSLFINRTVTADGKSKASMGGKRVPANVLTSIGSQLVSIHGQSDQIQLKNTNAQREAIDSFGGSKLESALNAYRHSYKAWKAHQKKLIEIEATADQRKWETQALEKLLQDYNELAPEEGEDEALEAEIATLSNVDAAKEAFGEAYEIIDPSESENGDPLTAIRDVSRALSKVSSYNKEWEELYDRAENVSALLEDLRADISKEASNLDIDSIERLYEAQERLALLKQYTRKNGKTLNEAIEKAEQATQRLNELEELNAPSDELEEQLEQLRKDMQEAAEGLSKARKASARRVEASVNKEMAGLAMSGTKFIVSITDTDYSSSGSDEVEFLLAHQGQEPAPIAKTASGGELSRIMLAMEVSMKGNHGTIIFDEVDSGVGGETAAEIGKRLALLAKDVQVIVVTHLPQVAAYADNHLKVQKTVSTTDVETTVATLDESERVKEIARMLSGLTESDSGKIHAEELLATARSFKHSH